MEPCAALTEAFEPAVRADMRGSPSSLEEHGPVFADHVCARCDVERAGFPGRDGQDRGLTDGVTCGLRTAGRESNPVSPLGRYDDNKNDHHDLFS